MITLTTDKIEAGKIFVWGNIGKDIKALDEDRMLAVAQKDPDYHLALKCNSEVSDIVKALRDSKGVLTDKIKSMVINTNNKDNLFREISAFLQESEDMLSIGSFMTGEMAKKTALMKLMEDD